MRWLIGIAVVMLIAHMLFKRAERAEARRLETRRIADAPAQLARQDGTHDA